MMPVMMGYSATILTQIPYMCSPIAAV